MQAFSYTFICIYIAPERSISMVENETNKKILKGGKKYIENLGNQELYVMCDMRTRVSGLGQVGHSFAPCLLLK